MAFPGVSDGVLCPSVRSIDTLAQLMGGFWSDISKTSTGAKRSALDQPRMQLLQQRVGVRHRPEQRQLRSLGGGVMRDQPDRHQECPAAGCAIPSQGDSGTFTPGTSGDSKGARTVAAVKAWDVLP